MMSELFLAAAESVGPLLRAPELAARWHEPSVLAEFRTSGLAGHLARAVLNVERYLDSEVDPGAAQRDAITYFLTTGDSDTNNPAAPTNQTVRERGEQDAAVGPLAVAEAYDAARARLAERLPTVASDQPVLMFGHSVLPLDQSLLTRLVELVVHADDLATTLDIPAPRFSDEAMDLVITTLVLIARRRHGGQAVLRTLARRERAPLTVAAF